MAAEHSSAGDPLMRHAVADAARKFSDSEEARRKIVRIWERLTKEEKEAAQAAYAASLWNDWKE